MSIYSIETNKYLFMEIKKMTRKKKQKVVNPADVRTFEVTSTLKADSNVELCVRVKATSEGAAYGAFRDHLSDLNRSASKRGDESFEVHIFHKPRKVVEIKEEHFQGILSISFADGLA